MAIIDKKSLTTEQLMAGSVKPLIELICVDKNGVEPILENIKINKKQLYIKRPEYYKDKPFSFTFTGLINKFVQQGFEEVYFRNDDFDNPTIIYTNSYNIKEKGLSFIKYDNEFMIWSNNRIIK